MARLDEEFERRWHVEAEAVASGMKDWRLEDFALASRAADLQDKASGRAAKLVPVVVLESQGKQERTILTYCGREVHLKCDYACCLACRSGLSLVDEDMELLPGTTQSTAAGGSGALEHVDAVRACGATPKQPAQPETPPAVPTTAPRSSTATLPEHGLRSGKAS